MDYLRATFDATKETCLAHGKFFGALLLDEKAENVLLCLDCLKEKQDAQFIDVNDCLNERSVQKNYNLIADLIYSDGLEFPQSLQTKINGIDILLDETCRLIQNFKVHFKRTLKKSLHKMSLKSIAKAQIDECRDNCLDIISALSVKDQLKGNDPDLQKFIQNFSGLKNYQHKVDEIVSQLAGKIDSYSVPLTKEIEILHKLILSFNPEVMSAAMSTLIHK